MSNYPPTAYSAQAQTWSLAQDRRGIIYVGNQSGVLEYDGGEWSLIQISGQKTVRSVAVSDGKLHIVFWDSRFTSVSTIESEQLQKVPQNGEFRRQFIYIVFLYKQDTVIIGGQYGGFCKGKSLSR